MEQDNSRFIPLQGCINFRDLGGYSAGNGQTVKWRRLFRSDAVHSMTPQDIDFVYNTLGVVTLIDLRDAAEVRRDGGNGALPSSARYHHLPFLAEHGITPFSPSEDPADRLAGIYLWILANSGALVAGALNTLAQEGHLPAVFHCTAGKDRTGVLAALILGILGVDDQQIMADYDLTNQTMDRLYQRLRAIPGNEMRPRSSFEAQPKAMEEFLNTLRDDYGGAESYAKAKGLPQAAIDQLRASLLQ